MITEYSIAVNRQAEGPFSLEEILKKEISPETLVWKTGMENWVKAEELPELSVLFQPIEVVTPEERIWYAMINGNRQVGPLSITELINEGLNLETPVWKAGMPDWQQAKTQPEFREHFSKGFEKTGYGPGVPPNPFAGNPQYNHNFYYNNQRQYSDPYTRKNQPYQNGFKTNWLPWAIGATVAGFLCSCIGAIFGIIAIVQANKANTLYSQGYDEAGDRANGNAKIMTIIGYIFAGIGILFTMVFKGVYSSFLNF